MKINLFHFFKKLLTMLGIGLCIISFGSLSSDLVPWWSFCLPLLLLGFLLKRKRFLVNGFNLGFFAGFISWAGINSYYLWYYGKVFQQVSALLKIDAVWTVILSGLICGSVSGLAVFIGASMVKEKSLLK